MESLDCINFLPPIQSASTLLQLHEVVQKLLIQYHLTEFQELYKGLTYTQLGEIVESECAEDPEMSTVALMLYYADRKRQALLEAAAEGK